MGVQVQMLETLAHTLPGRSDDTPQAIFIQALRDVIDVDVFSGLDEFDGQKVVEGAASLELLVRYTRLLNEKRPMVFLIEDIPSPEVVDACLLLFHIGNRQRSASTSNQLEA